MRRISSNIPIAVLSGLATATPAFAHGAKPGSFGQLTRAWEYDPFIILPLVVAGGLYGYGVRRLWKNSAPGRGILPREAICYAGGWLALFVALVSPLHAWGRALFSAHMTQHEVLMLVAAPLLVLGRPLIPYLWALPQDWVRASGRWTRNRWWRRIWRTLTAPLAAWAIHGIALWVWHLPSFYQATIDHELVHTLQHASFFGTALLFWWAIIHHRRGAAAYGFALLYLFTTALHSGLLGALLTFARSLWYPAYTATTPLWGLTPLEDQQLGGLIMWIPAGFVYVGAGLALFAGWVRESERRVLRRERSALGRA